MSYRHAMFGLTNRLLSTGVNTWNGLGLYKIPIISKPNCRNDSSPNGKMNLIILYLQKIAMWENSNVAGLLVYPEATYVDIGIWEYYTGSGLLSTRPIITSAEYYTGSGVFVVRRIKSLPCTKSGQHTHIFFKSTRIDCRHAHRVLITIAVHL